MIRRFRRPTLIGLPRTIQGTPIEHSPVMVTLDAMNRPAEDVRKAMLQMWNTPWIDNQGDYYE